MLFFEGVLLHLQLDELLDLLEDLHVVLRDESDGAAGPASTGGAADPVNVVFGVGGDVVVENAVDTGDVQAT